MKMWYWDMSYWCLKNLKASGNRLKGKGWDGYKYSWTYHKVCGMTKKFISDLHKLRYAIGSV